VTESTQSQAFDERSALEELEQLADKIQLSRRQRAQTVAEFDAFVRTFREDRYAATIAAIKNEERRADDRPAASNAATHASRGVVPVVDVGVPSDSVVAPVSVPESTPWAVLVPREPVALSVARPRAAYVAVALAALAVVAVGTLLWRSAMVPEAPAAQSAPSVVPSASTAPASPIASAPSVPAPAPTAEPPRALTIELVTIRPVWARVTVDGRRAIAREIAADTRMSFGADQAIAIRAGDAGAFRLVVDGKDQGVLGPDGQVFDKAFTAKTR
jgi:Domain of unknown function (DUF4115)